MFFAAAMAINIGIDYVPVAQPVAKAISEWTIQATLAQSATLGDTTVEAKGMLTGWIPDWQSYIIYGVVVFIAIMVFKRFLRAT